jgi:serine/threonine-protein kinase
VELKTGDLVSGRYRLEKPLGEGGFGAVYKVTDEHTGRQLALKVILSDLAQDPVQIKRFEREASVLKEIRHSGLVQLLDYSLEGDPRYLVFELIEGEDLSRLLERGHLSPDRALDLARQIADAVGYMHEHGLVHRDLKPQNVKVRPGDVCCVMDLGLAKHFGDARRTVEALTREGSIIGTAEYMAPEVLSESPPTPAYDVWAIGVMLYEMLAGEHPMPREVRDTQDFVTMLRWLKDPEMPSVRRVRPGLPARLDRLLERLLDPDPKVRAATGAEAARLIEEAAAVLVAGVPARPTPKTEEQQLPGAQALSRQGTGRLMAVTQAQVQQRAAVTRASGKTPALSVVASARRAERARGAAIAMGAFVGLGALAGVAVWRLAGRGPAGVATVVPPVSRSPSLAPLAASRDEDAEQLVARLTRKDQGRLNETWLKGFASKHKAYLKTDPARVSAALKAHFEDIGVLKPLEAFLARSKDYFANEKIPERDRWATRSALCDVELLEYFCEEHGIPVPWGVHSVARCAGKWDSVFDPRSEGLLAGDKFKHFIRSGMGGERRDDIRFSDGAFTYSIDLKGLEGRSASVWFATSDLLPSYVIMLTLNAGRRLLRGLPPDPIAPGLRVRSEGVHVEGGGQNWRGDEFLSLYPAHFDGRRRYLGRHVPPCWLRPAKNDLTVNLVDIPLASLASLERPCVWDKVLSVSR